MKTAFLFPGQGAQVIGMGKDFYETDPVAKEVFEKANKVTGKNITKLCFEGPEEELAKTENTQLAILTTSLAILEVIKQKGIKPDMAVGLSLGEYTALIASGMLSLEEGISLVQKRGYYMGNFVPKEEYAMAAVIGLDAKIIEQICHEISQTGKFIVPANYNCHVQTAISGEKQAIEEAIEKLKQAEAKKVIPLKTGGPFHTEKLKQAKEKYEKELEKVTFQKGNIQVIKNIDGTFYHENDNIQEILANHIISPVRFDLAIELMKREGIEQYIEIGPGKVLSGFVKKQNKESITYNIDTVEKLENLLNHKGE